MLGIIVVSALSSMLVGLVAGCLIFALDVSRVRYRLRQSGLHERPSSLLRSAEEMAVLAREGHRVLVLELDNYLFFGSAYRLFEDVARRLSKGGFQTLILDFSHVRGMDSSAAAVFAKVTYRADNARCALLFAGCSEIERRMLDAAAVEVEYFDELDDALETAESRIITATMERQCKSALSDWLAAALGRKEAASLAPRLARREYLAGAYLCRQGEPTETLLSSKAVVSPFSSRHRARSRERCDRSPRIRSSGRSVSSPSHREPRRCSSRRMPSSGPSTERRSKPCANATRIPPPRCMPMSFASSPSV